jgi:glycosyltransferase involved in cell wall biosynthesis
VFSVIDASAFEILRYVPPAVLRVGMVHDTLPSAVNLIRIYRNYIDQVTVVARILLEDVERCAPGMPATYLQHGVPMAAIGKMRDPNPSDPLKLIFYGRFHQDSKRVRIFPEMVAALQRRGIPFRWTLHGSGIEEPFLRRSFEREIARGQIVFSAPVDYRALPEIVRQHDIYILASAHEGGPLTLLESMALGLVPVCGEIPCLIQEVIDASNGFRVPFQDAEAYARAIEILHRNRERLESMSQAARSTIQQNFSATAMARRYIEFVQRHTTGSTMAWPRDIQAAPMLEQNPWRYTAVGRIWRRVGKRVKAARLAS